MNAATREDLDRVPIPVEDGAPVGACVVATTEGWRTAWAVGGGRQKDPFGPVYAAPRDATRASAYLNARGSR